jgi:RNA polymerase sigma-70 factor, ECF subfamily
LPAASFRNDRSPGSDVSEIGELQASDDALMRRAQADESQALGLLYERHVGRALRVAHSVSRDPECAEDAVQDGFLSIWRARANYRPGFSSFQGWAMSIVRNRAIDLNRRNAANHRPPAGDHDCDCAPSAARLPDEETIAHVEAHALRAILRQLPKAQARVIVLAYFGELTHTEIAKQLALPLGTVKGRMRLGLQKLRTEIEQVGGRGSETLQSRPIPRTCANRAVAPGYCDERSTGKQLANNRKQP